MQNAEAAWQGFLARLRPGRPQASVFGGGVRKGSRARPAQSHCGPVARGLMASGFRGRVKLGLGHAGTALAAFFHLAAGAEVGQQRPRKRQKGGASGRAERAP